MREISKIDKVGKGARYKVFVDDEFFGVFEAEILARHCLKTGEQFSDEFFEELKIENGDYACFNRSLAVLEKGMKSEKMLKDFLKEKGYPYLCITKACEKLKEYGYINDEVFCDNFIASYSGSKSKKKLKYDLLAKGISSEIIESKLAEISDDDENEKCLAFAEKFMKNREIDQKTKQKLYNHLLGKGFEFSTISSVWEKVKNDRN
jgi:regulatory protein